MLLFLINTFHFKKSFHYLEMSRQILNVLIIIICNSFNKYSTSYIINQKMENFIIREEIVNFLTFIIIYLAILLKLLN